MKMKVTDYIANYIADVGITQVFSVVGGGSMHLNDSFSHCKRLSVMYNHHEQASAICAEGYARVNNRTAAVCVTSGPGGTNALTGVLCAWQDSQPLIVFSGQVRYNTTIASTGLLLRQFGEQEYNIIDSVSAMTKYAVMVTNANDIRYHIEKALYLAQNGRRGPVWLDIPLDIQARTIDTDKLAGFTPQVPKEEARTNAEIIIKQLENAERPVLVAGSGIRTTGVLQQLKLFVEYSGLPVICPTGTADLFSREDTYYYGNFGVFGGRAGNFIVQNADLLVSLGARLSFKQTGFNFEKFAPNARRVAVDIDENELRKPSVNIDVPINADIAGIVPHLAESGYVMDNRKWLGYCDTLRHKFPVVTNKHRDNDGVSAYYFAELITKEIDDALIVVGNSCACVQFLQTGISNSKQRMFGNVNCGTMGYDIPAACGAAVSSGRDVICVTGEGSAQMNIQELQTIIHNKLPIRIVIFNNNCYQAIVQTHSNFFGRLSGCDFSSGISFPSFEKIACAYGFPYHSASGNTQLVDAANWLKSQDSYCILELFQNKTEHIEPKASGRQLPNGDIVSPPIDDISPFLSREEYESCQYESFSNRNN